MVQGFIVLRIVYYLILKNILLLEYAMYHFWLEVLYRKPEKPQVSENHYMWVSATQLFKLGNETRKEEN